MEINAFFVSLLSVFSSTKVFVVFLSFIGLFLLSKISIYALEFFILFTSNFTLSEKIYIPQTVKIKIIIIVAKERKITYNHFFSDFFILFIMAIYFVIML